MVDIAYGIIYASDNARTQSRNEEGRALARLRLDKIGYLLAVSIDNGPTKPK